MADSIYVPLLPKSHTIRLIDLQPGEWSDHIECELRETSIEAARNRYVTISYTWGNIEITQQVFIWCNSRQVPISKNLYTILRRLRRPDYSILVWADALCINQTDSFERTHQVGLMGEIYRNSRETVIWLGEQTEHDDVGERFVGRCITAQDREALRWGGPPRIAWQGNAGDRNLATYMWDYMQSKERARKSPHASVSGDVHLPYNDIFGAFCLIYSLARGTSTLAINFLEESDIKTLEGLRFPRVWYGSRSKSMHIRDSRSARVWAGLERLMSRPWWSRIWVVQETVLARNATVQYGMLSAPWTMFANAAAHYEQERHKLCLDLAGTLQGNELLNRFSNSVLQIDNTRSHHQKVAEGVTLLSLLWKFRSLEASDKRDKVFALLGLTTNWQGFTPMLPDYQIDVGITFLSTAVTTIAQSRSLSVLTGDLDAGLGRKRLKGIPSWVMDWSLPCLQPEIERVNSLNMYDASRGSVGRVRFHELHSILEVKGTYVDDVVTVGDISRHTQISDTLSIIREWNFLVKELESKCPQYPTGVSYHEAFWRTLLGDMVHTGHVADTSKSNDESTYRRAMDTDFRAFEAWRMWSRCISRDTWGRAATFTQRDLDEGISSIHYALKTATASRRFFLTRDGYMGIGPKSTMPGDKLYVLKGSRVPFLVRPDSLKNCSGMRWRSLVDAKYDTSPGASTCEDVHSCHRLVGDCFAYGLMDGEAFVDPGHRIRRTRRIFLV
ncbi:hypothetical protein K469DRAFT_699217 [Zopfia rhizophila CBS 207.26]|uniref:Heterokaryon incompatibility domain-containing protein n=1 Tax=Zopfia rhizophila CBS 207.26 TaxID=1314779 RepID=A0A6A6EXG1_9PEZI|nr:hypothetical protein K469DRAFT_699217 [Zopfia rhizophila CBS 207.26]